jgi:hypothetical protein
MIAGRRLHNVIRIQQGKWNARETFEYRFEVNKEDGLFACMARLRGGLFVAGFACKARHDAAL